MLQEEYITIELKCQQYSCKTYMRKEEGTEGVLILESKQRTEDIHCPYCGGPVHIWDTVDTSLRDMPIQAETRQDVLFLHHRYRCTKCHRKHTEGIPSVYPGTRITECAATWIKTLLLNKMPIKAIQGITGIHWETIRRIHMDMLETTLSQHMKASKYKPKYLAVDKFAIHKGHTYATYVIIDSPASHPALSVCCNQAFVHFEKNKTRHTGSTTVEPSMPCFIFLFAVGQIRRMHQSIRHRIVIRVSPASFP